MNGTPDLLIALASSAAVGLLVGLERERKPGTKAGVRTFALIAVLGTLAAVLSEDSGSGWVLAAGALCVTGALVAAYLQDPASAGGDAGTTTIVAALAVYLLGAAFHYGHAVEGAALGVAMTVLLYFKAELEGFSQKLTAQDIRSMLQFAVLTAVVLPLLPDRSFGPYDVLNPFQIWLMVVLVSAVSLAGYVAWRLTLGRHGLVATGVLGGLVSSTATTLVHARNVAAGAQPAAAALVVILLANATMLLRVLVMVGVVAPATLPYAAVVIVPALLLALAGVAWRWQAASRAPAPDEAAYANPTQLRMALGFGAVYAIVLLLAAWANDWLGARGIVALAAISGLTDVDAITLSSLRLWANGAATQLTVLTAIAVAVGSNLLFKTGIAATAGGRPLLAPLLWGFSGPLLGLAAGVALLRSLA